MNTAVLASAIAALIAFTVPSLAQSQHRAEDIIQFFATAVDLGPTRGICVGTEQECAERRQANEAVPTGLDMLVTFELNSAELTAEARSTLAEFAKALGDNRLRTHTFIVEGHTDARGSETYNEGLSQRRAQSVAAFLVATGVDGARLRALGKGMSSPRVDDPYDPVNRRVEMRINLE